MITPLRSRAVAVPAVPACARPDPEWSLATGRRTTRSIVAVAVPAVVVLPALAMLACGVPGAPAQHPDPLAAAPAVAVATPGSLEDATERAIVGAVDAGAAEALTLLERIVNINSGTMNFAGVREVGAVLRAELDALGFTTRWVDGAAFGRAGHLVAERTGAGPRLLLIGHLDTVFEPSSPFQRFERLNDTTARGPGVIDMKGGDVIIVQALAALKAAGALDRMTITVVMNGDEEHPGAPLARSAPRADRGVERRRRGDRLRGRQRRSAQGEHRAARRVGVDPALHRHAGPLVADLPRRRRAGRDLRGGARARRLPHAARRAAVPHVQPRGRARRHRGGARRAAEPGQRVRQDQRRREGDGRAGRSAHAVARAARRGQGGDARDRRAVAAAHQRRRSSSTTATRRWPRRTGTAGCSRSTTP